jgi:hypothetical protein
MEPDGLNFSRTRAELEADSTLRDIASSEVRSDPVTRQTGRSASASEGEASQDWGENSAEGRLIAARVRRHQAARKCVVSSNIS